MTYQDTIARTGQLISAYNGTRDGIDAVSVTRMQAQNRFRTGFDIARHTAGSCARTWPPMMPILRTAPSHWAAGMVALPGFNWTLSFRQQIYDARVDAGRDVSGYDRARLMSVDHDDTEFGVQADERIRTFQRDAAARAGIFHHLITLPTYHTTALSTDNLAKAYSGEAAL